MFDTIRTAVMILYTAGLVTMIGCASNDHKACPTREEEAVSMCRAELRCKQENTTYGVGLGVGKPTDSSIIGTRTMATTDNYNDCIEKDLSDQRSRNQVVE